MIGTLFRLVVVSASAMLIVGFALVAGSSAPAIAQGVSRSAPERYASGRYLEPRSLTIRRSNYRSNYRSKYRAPRAPRAPKPVVALRAADLICPNPRNKRAPCVSMRQRVHAVSLMQAPGADAFRLGSSVLAPPRVPEPEFGQASPLLGHAIMLAHMRPLIYPDILKRVSAFGAAVRPPVYPGLYGRPGYGYFLPDGGAFDGYRP